MQNFIWALPQKARHQVCFNLDRSRRMSLLEPSYQLNRVNQATKMGHLKEEYSSPGVFKSPESSQNTPKMVYSHLPLQCHGALKSLLCSLSPRHHISCISDSVCRNTSSMCCHSQFRDLLRQKKSRKLGTGN